MPRVLPATKQTGVDEVRSEGSYEPCVAIRMCHVGEAELKSVRDSRDVAIEAI